MKIGVVLPAGGRGVRFGAETPKQYLPLRGVPVIVHTIGRFASFPGVVEIVVAAASEYHSTLRDLDRKYGWGIVRLAEGGDTRQSSVSSALAMISGDVDVVAVHDAVRPFVTRSLFERVVDAASESGAAIPVLPPRETIHQVVGRRIVATPNRQSLVAAQTPQCFRRDQLLDLMERASREGWDTTDEAALAVRGGIGVTIVDGDDRNIKLTRPTDLEIAEAHYDQWSIDT